MAYQLSSDYLEVAKTEVKRTQKLAVQYMDTTDPNIRRVDKLLDQFDDAFDHFNSTFLTMTQNHFTDILKIEDYESWAETQIMFKVLTDDELTSLWDRQKVLSDSLSPSSPTSTSPKIKYPEIKLVKFHGDKTRWDTWWQGFNSMVHSKKELDAITKFTYLLTTLEGEPRKSVDHFEVTDSGYVLDIQALKDKYSDPQASKRILVYKLLDIKVPGLNKLDLEDFKEDYLAFTHKLELLEINVEESEWWLREHLLRRLPQAVSVYICDKANSIYPTVSEIMENLTLYIKHHCSVKQKADVSFIHPAAKTPSNSGRHNSNSSKNFPGKFSKKSAHAHSMVGKSSHSTYLCAFCKGEHLTRICTTYSTRQQRLDRLKQLQRCINCCRQHSVENCPTKLAPCYNCGGDHHTWLCQNKSTNANHA